ncbi:MAG: hypothetical protein JJU45_12050 [Acidimicrobiia bacterium]|nr:hypothetical protein [Acidimicrobiia bacterium]
MDLTVVVDRDDSHDRLRLGIASEQHRPGSETIRSRSVVASRPAEAVVVLSVEICDEVEILHG